MNRILPLLLCALVVSATSCKSSKTSTSKASEIYGPGVVQYPVVVDLDVKEEKVSGTVQWRGGNVSMNTLKEMAISDAVKKANADVLVEPRFDIEVKGRTKTVVATGYPANYKNFRNALASDTLVMKVGLIQNTEAIESAPDPKKTRRTLKIFGGAVAGFVVGILILLW